MVLITIFAIIWIVAALAVPFFVKGDMPRWARRVLPMMGVITAIGGAIFFAPLLANGGQLVPDSVEWPIGRTSDAIEMTSSGEFVVAHTPSGRIQVYDRDLQFLRGWHIQPDGGTFWLDEPRDRSDVVDVYSVRRKDRSRYDLDGTWLESESVTYASPPLWDESARRDLSIPTKWWQRPLTSPFYAILFIAPGIASQVAIARMFDASLPGDHWRRRAREIRARR